MGTASQKRYYHPGRLGYSGTFMAKSDADAVFGLMYAQCEDDFKRIESNYIDILGRTAEIKGVGSIYDDLYTRLVIDSAGAIKDYAKSPAWLKKLLHAWADAMNYYLYKHRRKNRHG